MVFCFFKKLIQPLMMKLRERCFKGEVFYSHGKSNSCGVLIYLIGSKKLFIRNKLSDNDGRILILDVDIDDENFILICITLTPKLNN